MSQKVAYVTGGMGGIGTAICQRLHKEGFKVIAGCGPTRDHAKWIGEQAALGYTFYASVGNVGDWDSTVEAFTKTKAEHGVIDVLVNNAGIQHVARIENFPTERWDAVIAINLSSAFHASRMVIPGMRARNWGRIINIASVHGLVGSAEKSAYVAAKHGIVGLTKVCALENATSGVTCNAICPGWVLTPLVQKQVDAKALALGVSNDEAKRLLLAEKEPSLQFTTPEELGALAVFLCSPAADNVRGVAWNMDGGWAAQ